VTIVKPPLPTVTLQRVRHMRREPTDVECRLWQYLRASRFEGLKFRRQHPVPPYVADFCCIEKNLIVQLDGSQHSPENDGARTAYLESQGYRVLRFWNNDVLLKTDSVLEAIWNAVHAPHPHPQPAPRPCAARRPFGENASQWLAIVIPSPGGRGA